MQLTDLLSIESVRIPLESRVKDDVLRELVDVAMSAESGEVRDEVLQAVRERESVLSTGIGYGVAIPHGKTGALTDLRLAAGRSTVPIDFNALDGKPVQLFFLLIGPEASAGPHIRALSRISRLVRKDEIRDHLIACNTPEEFMRALHEAEAQQAT